MTVILPMPLKYIGDPYTKIYLEMYYDTDQMRFHLMTNQGHIDGFYLFSFDTEFFDDGELHHLHLWTSIGSRMESIEFVGRSQLKIIGVDICEEL
jgi:hypothetical protein